MDWKEFIARSFHTIRLFERNLGSVKRKRFYKLSSPMIARSKQKCKKRVNNEKETKEFWMKQSKFKMAIRGDKYMPENILRDLLTEEQRRQFDFLEEKMEREVFPFIASHIPNFSDHGFGHSKRIIENLNKMLSSDSSLLERLSNWDIYVLFLSAYLHDIGLLISTIDGETLSDKQIRELHHELSGGFVRRHYSKFGIENQQTAEVVARVCETHRRKVPVEENLEEQVAFGGETLHLQFIGALFKLADALDTDFRRAPEATSNYVLSLPPESKRHWEACQLISGFEIADNRVKLNIQINEESQESIAIWKTAELYDELWRIKDILAVNMFPLIDVISLVRNRGTGESIQMSGKELFQDSSKREAEAHLFLRALRESTF